MSAPSLSTHELHALAAPLEQYLRHTKVEEVAPPFPDLIYVDADDRVPSAFKKIVEAGLHCVPVRKRVEDPAGGHHYVFCGLVDLLDIVTVVLQTFGEVDVSNSDSFFSMLESEADFVTRPIGDVMNSSKRNPWHAISCESTLFDAVGVMVRNQLHRAPIVSADGKHLHSILTQSAIIRWLWTHHKEFEGLGKLSVSQLHAMTTPITSVPSTTRTIDAFRLLYERKISSVAIVDAAAAGDGIIGVLSESDIRALGFDASFFARIYAPVEDFVKLIRQSRVDTTVHPFISINPNTQIQQGIGMMTAAGVHRIYVLESPESKHAIGCSSMYDVLRSLWNVCS